MAASEHVSKLFCSLEGILERCFVFPNIMLRRDVWYFMKEEFVSPRTAVRITEVQKQPLGSALPNSCS